MKTLEEMSKSELDFVLSQLKEQLEEVMDERSLIIGPQNGHVSSKYISKHAVKFAKEMDDLNARIAQVTTLLEN